MLALFAVQAFIDHDNCTALATCEHSERLTMTFQYGFALHCAIFVNQVYVEPYYRFQNAISDDKQISVLAAISQSLENIMHLTTLALSAYMIYQTYIPDAVDCFDVKLESERIWLRALAYAQVAKIILFFFLRRQFASLEIEDFAEQSIEDMLNRSSLDRSDPQRGTYSLLTKDMDE